MHSSFVETISRSIWTRGSLDMRIPFTGNKERNLKNNENPNLHHVFFHVNFNKMLIYKKLSTVKMFKQIINCHLAQTTIKFCHWETVNLPLKPFKCYSWLSCDVFWSCSVSSSTSLWIWKPWLLASLLATELYVVISVTLH